MSDVPPEGARLALVHGPDDDILELSPEQARAAFELHPDLLHQYRKHSAMSGRKGRLIVIDAALAATILEQVGSRLRLPRPIVDYSDIRDDWDAPFRKLRQERDQLIDTLNPDGRYGIIWVEMA